MEEGMRSLFLIVGLATLSIPSVAQWERITSPVAGSDFLSAMVSSQENLFVSGIHQNTGTNYIVRSPDLGVTWLRADSTIPFQVNGSDVLSMTSIGNRVFAGTGIGVYRSTDLGATWTKGGTFAGYTEAYSLGVKDTTLYVGYYNVARSTNYGTSWTPAQFGLPASITMAVVATGNYIFAASDGVYRSTDGGVNFSSINARIGSVNTMDLVLSGTTLFAANVDSGVFRSTNYGANWQLVNTGLVGQARRASRLLAGPGMVFVWTDSGMYATNNNGASWVMAADQELYTSPMAIRGDFVFAKGAFGLMRHPLYDFFPVGSVSSDVTGPGTYSFNSGGNITGVTLNLTSVPYATMLTVNRFDGAAVSPSFSGTPPATTSGYRWLISAGLAGYTVTGTIRISLSAFGAGVADPTSVKIYKRPSSGMGTFVELPTTYDAGTNELVATITGFSEFILGGSAGALDVEDSPAVPDRFALFQNYPNPFNPTTVIRYEVPVAGEVRLSVYDLLGREVAILVNKNQGQGKYDVRFDATGLASGIYLYRLVAGKFTQTHKMALLK
jgi:hypothetical protein